MKFEIVDIEELSGSRAKIYSIMLDGDIYTLLDQFFDDNRKFDEEMKEIALKLKLMGETTGCRETFLKYTRGHPEMALLLYGIKISGCIV